MTLPLERARSRKPITWLTIVGVLLLPVVIGGILVAALYNPVERLDAMNVAIVNDDEPVEINGQMAPLGRQLTAGLVEGSDEEPSNLTWTISNTDDARDGIADGTYAAVITIPENFSAAATSTAPGSTPEQATISVETAPDSLIVDDAITAQVTTAAAALMGEQLSTVYLENVFLGFTTLGDQLGDAASGAHDLADGARTAADGTVSLADGIRQLADGAGQLGDGARDIADGASELSSGAGQLASGANDAADGLDSLAGGATTLAGGSKQIADALGLIAGQVPTDVPQVPSQVISAAQGIAQNSPQVTAQLTAAADDLTALAAQCDPAATPDICEGLSAAAQAARDNLGAATGLVGQAGTIAAGLEGLNGLSQLGTGLAELAAQSAQITTGIEGLAGGAQQAAGGVRQLGDGAAALGSGAGQLSTGAGQLADGIDQLGSGATDAADGADDLAGGITQLADGTETLANGLDTAATSLPSYTDTEATDLASVVANPVAANGIGTSLFGASAVPLLATLALWFGGLGSFVALRAVSAHALTSRRPSALLALRSLAPAAAIGAVQGLLLAGVVQLASSYDWAEWSVFALLCVVAGVAFAAVNQALVAVFGGAGRWIAALVGVLAVATGVVSTVPGALASVAGLMPTTPAYNAMLGALTAADGVGVGVVALIVWALLAFAATTLVVVRRRTTSARAVLTASPA